MMGISPHIDRLAGEIGALCNPEKIYLFHAKFNLRSEVTSFKLCIVADSADKTELERKIYLELDCEIPYDLVIYTTQEWTRFMQNPNSFAGEIRDKGVLIYDKTQASAESR